MKKTVLIFLINLWIILLGIQSALAQVNLETTLRGSMSRDNYGASVSMSADGNRMALGIPRGAYYLHVYVYERNGTEWNRLGDGIAGEKIDDRFGSSVSLSADGGYLAVGAPQNSGNGSWSGHARVYRWSGNSWSQIGNDIEGGKDDGLGTKVVISSNGRRVAICAKVGYVRIYDWNGVNWQMVGSELSGNSASLSADGSRIAVGSYSGYARIYDWNENFWKQVGGNLSGSSVSLSADGNRVAAGANNSVGMYEWDGISWQQLGGNIEGEDKYDKFGASISMSAKGDRVAIGAPSNNGNGTRAGRVKAYQWNGTAWVQFWSDINGFAENDDFGSSLSMSADGGRIVVGAPEYSDNYGTGYIKVFRLAGPRDYEAENAETNAEVVSALGNFSGAGFVGNINESGKYISFDVEVPEDGIYSINARYAAGIPEESILSVYVNGAGVTQTAFPSTENWNNWRNQLTFVVLNKGVNTIKFQYDERSSGGIHLDYIDVTQKLQEPEKYEAEYAQTNILFSQEASGFSGIGFLENIANEGQYVSFEIDAPEAGAYLIDTRYRLRKQDDKTLSMYVNGIDAVQVVFSPEWSWNSHLVLAQLNKGTNVVKFQRDADDSGNIDLDYIEVNPRPQEAEKYEAEYAQTNAEYSQRNKDFSGVGYITNLKEVGKYVSFEVEVPEEGEYVLNTRYYVGQDTGASTLSIYVNGIGTTQSIFPLANSWQNTLTFIRLNKGVNQIKFQKDAGDAGDIILDYIKVTPKPAEIEKYEAEYAQGNARFSQDGNGFSELGFIENLNEAGKYISFEVEVPEAGLYTINTRYAGSTSEENNLNVYVNDEDIIQVLLPSAKDLNTWQYSLIFASLNKGINTIKFQVDGDNSGDVRLDYIKVTPKPIETTKFEAEYANNNLLFNMEEIGFSGIGYVEGLNAKGKYISFEIEVSETSLYVIDARYSGYFWDPKALGVYVNDEIIQTMFPSTQGNWGNHSMVVPLKKGKNTLKFQQDVHHLSNMYLDYIEVKQTPEETGKYEAEYAQSNAKFSQENDGYSGIGLLKDINEEGKYVSFKLEVSEEGKYLLGTSYSCNATGTLSTYVNGVDAVQAIFSSSGGRWKNHLTMVNLIKGMNTVKFQRDADDSGDIHLDYMEVKPIPEETGIYEAEYTQNNVTYGQGAIANNTIGFTEGITEEGSYVSFQVEALEAGLYTVNTRYAVGDLDTKSLSVYVNGKELRQLAFLPTGSWSTWGNQQIVLTLNKGSNTIKFQRDAGDLGDVRMDYMEVKPKSKESGKYEAIYAETNAFNYANMVGDFYKNGKYVSFDVEVSKGGLYVINTRYKGNGGKLSTYVNGVDVAQAVFPKVGSDWGSDWGNVLMTVQLNEGKNTIKFQRDADDLNGVVLDYITITPKPEETGKYEAEFAETNSVFSEGSNNFSGIGFIKDITTQNSYVSFQVEVPETGSYVISTRYAGEMRIRQTLSIYVNGVDVGQAVFMSTDIWNNKFLSVQLTKGMNVVKFQRDSDDSGVISLDYIEVHPKPQSPTAKIYEAENSETNAVIGSGVSGFSGTGFVEYITEVGRYVSFDIEVDEAGLYTVDARYAVGTVTDKTMTVYVNGVYTKIAVFPSTGSWGNWGMENLELTLKKGKNTIKYQYNSNNTGWVNLDYIAVTPKSINGRRYEAESAETNGNFNNWGGQTSGSGYIENLNSIDKYITFQVNVAEQGIYEVNARYSSAWRESIMDVYVNGVKLEQVIFPSIKGHYWEDNLVLLPLDEGNNTVKLQYYDNLLGDLDLDYIEVKKLAESASSARIATVEPANAKSAFSAPYPNSVQDWLHIDYAGGSEQIKVTVCDMLGKIQKTDLLNSSDAKINVDGLKPGMYLFHFSDGKQTATYRVKKE